MAVKPTKDDTLRRIGAAGIAATISLSTLGGAFTAAAEPADTTQPDSGTTQQPDTPATPAYTAIVGKQSVTLARNGQGVWEGTLDDYDQWPGDTITVMAGADQTTAATTLTGTPTIDLESDTVGILNASGTGVYEGDIQADPDKQVEAAEFKVTVNYKFTTGSEITVTDGADGGHFTDVDGVPTATGKDVELGNDDKPAADEITLSDGTKLPIEWDADVQTRYDKDSQTSQAFKTGVAEGDVTGKATDQHTHEWHVKVNVQAVRADTWSVTVNGKTQNLTANEDGSQTLDVKEAQASRPADTLTATGVNGTTVTLDQTEETAITTEETAFGKLHVTGTAVYEAAQDATHPAIKVTLPVDYTIGEEITLKDGTKLTKTDDGKWTAPLAPRTLNADTSADTSVELSNGQTVTLGMGDAKAEYKDGATHIIRTMTGEDTVQVKDGDSTYPFSVTFATTAERTDTWEASVNDGDPQDMTTLDTLAQTLTVTGLDQYPAQTAKATRSDGKEADIDLAGVTGFTEASTKLGSIHVTGTAKYHKDADGDIATIGTPTFDIEAPFGYSTGEEITLDNDAHTAFTRDADNENHFTAVAPNVTLNDRNEPATDTLTLSDGTTAPITWDKTASAVERDGATYVTKKGVAEGHVTVTDKASNTTVDQTYTITVTAERAQDKTFTALTVEQATTDGNKTTIEVPGFTPDTKEYTITLPHSAVGDAYGLNVSAGVDAEIGAQKLTLGTGATRILRVTVNGEEYTVNVKFESADIQADSPAKLSGIYVNMSGDHTQGSLIDNWNPNRLDYVVTLTDTTTSPYVLPVAPDGVTIKASNITQSAQSSKQEWTVTDDATGATRTYTVTVTRPVKTAVTDFTPQTPVKQEQTVQPDSDTDTTLVSAGYVNADGEYVTSGTGTYDIPEGGTFSYEAKAGQSTTVTVSNTGMTYTYTVNVLAPDGKTFAQHAYTVTYITEATHKAELTGIAVNGTLINGFKPDKTDYKVKVNDPDQWTIVAQYDKTAGMSVQTDKDGADATITVKSGDNQQSRVYTVHVVKKLLGGDGTTGVGDLAETGATTGILAIIIAATLALGAFFLFIANHSRDIDAKLTSAVGTGPDPEPGDDTTDDADPSEPSGQPEDDSPTAGE